jgi:capsular exopolysaccharide synthesis family protein
LVLSRRRKGKSEKRNLVTYTNPDSIISEHFRTIRTNINFLSEKRKSKIFLLTSPRKGEGKSTTTANLAVTMAQQKERVLVIDANLREPRLHSIFKIENNIGLTNVLTNKAIFEDAVYKTEIGELEILTSGSTSFNPAELLGNNMMKDLLNKISDCYDIVLIDSPSVLKSTETRVLANQCDGVVLVLSKGVTPLEEVEEAKKVIEFAHARLVGAILNESK